MLYASPQTFRIGAVSRLTGVTTDLVRVWERRYAVVKPMRTETGNRIYTQDDIARLALIKQLVDSGDAIGTVASLSLNDLEERVNTMGKRAQPDAGQSEPIRIAVVGYGLTARMSRRRGELGKLELVGIFHDTLDMRERFETLKIDVTVVELPYIKSSTSIEISQLIKDTGAMGAVVVYGFGSSRHVRRLHVLPVVTLRAPTDITDVKQACLIASGNGSLSRLDRRTDEGATLSTIQPRRYNDRALARIATLSTTIECECSHHLADLVSSLVSFEQYSADCTNRNENDAALHRYLHATTAKARSLLETALARLIEIEGLEV